MKSKLRPTDHTPLGRAEIVELIAQHTRFRTGIGYDVHRFTEGRRLILGGVEIPHDRGLQGHSDADVIAHAAMDAVLGACGCSDIGTYFPDTDAAFKGADSLQLARQVAAIVAEQGFELHGLDLMVLAEEPRLKPHVPAMRDRLAEAFGLRSEQVGLKATTNETMGWVGRREGIACLASAIVRAVPQD
jgi:2-C-methyl-D-erythritol 2,4-cyclodiphosphate synthase